MMSYVILLEKAEIKTKYYAILKEWQTVLGTRAKTKEALVKDTSEEN